MTLTIKKNDMFSEPVEALVNTVNCVGVMGKGVALEFKKRWPENFKVYQKACKAGALKPGTMLSYDTHELFPSSGPRYLINFPTKMHWRSKSELAYIERGLDALASEIKLLSIKSIGIPPLGCGNGGLDWNIVKPLIISKLENLDGVDIVIFEPMNAIDPPEHENTEAFAMTYPRSMLLKTLSELEVRFDGAFDRISLQKIVYFLQVYGVRFNLSFSKQLYGPYSEALKKSFHIFEKNQLIQGFTSDERRSHVTPSGCARADEYLQSTAEPYEDIISKLGLLIQGYESPYGLELLSSVHWLGDQENCYPADKIVEALKEWNEGKSNRFDERTILAGYNRLVEDGLLPS